MTSKLSVSLSLHKILRENNNEKNLVQKHLANFNLTKRHLSQLSQIYIDQTRDGVNKDSFSEFYFVFNELTWKLSRF